MALLRRNRRPTFDSLTSFTRQALIRTGTTQRKSVFLLIFFFRHSKKQPRWPEFSGLLLANETTRQKLGEDVRGSLLTVGFKAA